MLLVAQAGNLGVILTLFFLTLPSTPTANSIGTTFSISQNVNIFHYFHCYPLGPSESPLPFARIPVTTYSLVSLIHPSVHNPNGFSSIWPVPSPIDYPPHPSPSLALCSSHTVLCNVPKTCCSKEQLAIAHSALFSQWGLQGVEEAREGRK